MAVQYSNINYGTGGVYNLIKQTSNPITDGTVIGYSPVQIYFASSSFSGLKKHPDQTKSVLGGKYSNGLAFQVIHLTDISQENVTDNLTIF